jgi:hypothetical protein
VPEFHAIGIPDNRAHGIHRLIQEVCRGMAPSAAAHTSTAALKAAERGGGRGAGSRVVGLARDAEPASHFGASTTTHLSGGQPSAGQTTLAVRHGYTTAFWWAAGILSSQARSSAAPCCAAACWRGKATPASKTRPPGSHKPAALPPQRPRSQ